jgi:hypothetical protein
MTSVQSTILGKAILAKP